MRLRSWSEGSAKEIWGKLELKHVKAAPEVTKLNHEKDRQIDQSKRSHIANPKSSISASQKLTTSLQVFIIRLRTYRRI